MRAHAALTVTKNIYWPLLNCGDTQITHATLAAAEAYGFADPADLVGRYLSDLQPIDCRRVGKIQWYLRNHGHTVPSDYVTLVLRPDGELVGHRRDLLQQMVGLDGEAYVTAIEVVQEVDHPRPPPDLASYGVTQDAVDKKTGAKTVKQLRDLYSAAQLALHCGETFATIVARCEEIATTVFGRPPGSGLDLALTNPAARHAGDSSFMATWTLHPDALHPVYLHQSCPECGRGWYAWSTKRHTCTACKSHLASRARGH